MTGALGLLAEGEAVLERRHHGQVIRSRRLAAGEVFEAASGGDGRSASLCVRALTDGVLYILPPSPDVGRGKGQRISLSLRKSAWTLLVVLAILALTWQDLSRLLSGAFFLVSSSAGARGAERDAAQMLEYAAQVDPHAAFAFNQQGYLRLQQGDLAEAQADFLHTLRVDADNAPALNNLAVTYFTLGQGTQALAAQRSAAVHSPDRAAVQYNLGGILLERGEEREALRAFREASLIAPAWALPHVQMGCLHLRRLDHARAEKEAREALRLDPAQGAAQLVLAIALYHQGRLPEAQSALAQALEIDPAQPVARFYQALTLNALGQTEAALSLLEKLNGETDDPLVAARLETEIEALRRSLQDSVP